MKPSSKAALTLANKVPSKEQIQLFYVLCIHPSLKHQEHIEWSESRSKKNHFYLNYNKQYLPCSSQRRNHSSFILKIVGIWVELLMVFSLVTLARWHTIHETWECEDSGPPWHAEQLGRLCSGATWPHALRPLDAPALPVRGEGGRMRG